MARSRVSYLSWVAVSIVCLVLTLAPPASSQTHRWSASVLPPEHKITIDPASGARTVFVTTGEASDTNLYFHYRAWLADESMVVFYSNRTGRSELFGYVETTGELVRLVRSEDPPFGGATCSRHSNRIYAVRGQTVLGLDVAVRIGSGSRKTTVNVHARTIGELPKDGGLRGGLSENADGRLIAFAYTDAKDPKINHIAAMEIETGTIMPIASVDYPVSHLQCSWSRPDLLMFARSYPEGDRMEPSKDPDGPPNYRIWHVDLSGRPPWPIHPQKTGELVTHECWWTEDRLTFCGGHHPHEQHVKVYDLATRRISIVGAGSWWPDATPAQITKRGWWHAAGSPNGRWVVADTFHGDIVIFDAYTTEERPLSLDHRAYGKGGQHPHVGWSPSSDRVIFTSNKRGNPDVVITYLPKRWK